MSDLRLISVATRCLFAPGAASESLDDSAANYEQIGGVQLGDRSHAMTFHPDVKDSIVFTPNCRQAEIVRSIARADAGLRVSQAA